MAFRLFLLALASFVLVTAAPADNHEEERKNDELDAVPYATIVEYEIVEYDYEVVVEETTGPPATGGSGDKGKGSGDKGKGSGDKGKGSGDKGKGSGDKGKGSGDKGKGSGGSGSGSGGNASGSKCTCGKANSKSTRVVNGENAQPNEFPWQIFLIATDDKRRQFVCGGSIVSKKHIITAAHCTTLPKDATTLNIKVLIGAHDMRRPPVLEVAAAKVINHHKYDHTSVDYDIAIIELAKELPLGNPKVGAICLPSSGEDHTGKNVIVSGWGKTAVSENPSILQKTQYKVVSQATCKASWGPSRITPRMVCGGGEGKSSSCNGDSGGPLTYQDKKGHYELVGLVSFGTEVCNTKGTYDVYTRVANPELIKWIKKHTKGTQTCN